MGDPAVGIDADMRVRRANGPPNRFLIRLKKYQALPFLVDDISGSRALALFFVKDGASTLFGGSL